MERYSPLGDERVFVADLRLAGPDPDVFSARRAAATLAELPCPTIAVWSSAASAAAARLAARFDVVVDDDASLRRVLAGIDAAPVAALALVQLLRRSEELAIHDGLIAESFVYSTLQSGPEFAAWRARQPEGTAQVHQSSDPPVLVSRNDGELELTLNRPDRHNAYSIEMRDALVEALRVAAIDPSVTAVRLRGNGRSFCSGGDLSEFGELPDPATAHAIRSMRSAPRLLAVLADKLRVDVHGTCVGAGVELPAFAGVVTASRDASFCLPELSMGLVPGAGGTVSIPRRVGRQRTAYMALSGVRVDAETALAWGLVDELRA